MTDPDNSARVAESGPSGAIGPSSDAFAFVAYGVAAAAVAAQCAGAWARSGALWGADAFAFLPRPALGLGLGAAVALALIAARSIGATARGGPSRAPWAPVAAMAAAGFAFWTFRIRHVLLGDGIPITHVMPDERGLHPRDPLGSMFVQALYRWLAPAFTHPGATRAQIVQDCVAVGSVAAGVLFVLSAWWLAREIVRGFPARAPENAGRLAGWLALLLLAQGYAQIFFGYVEIYALPITVAALYVAASLRFLRGAGSIALPLAAAALGVALDFTGVVLGPSTLVLVGAGLADPARRRAVARDAALLVALSAAFVAWLTLGPARYPVVTHLAAMLASGHAGAGYVFSRAHVRDFLNAQLLLGPFGLYLALPAVAALPLRGGLPRASVAFLVTAAGAIAWACWTAPDLPLGYARDWDLFAPLVVVMVAAALALTLALVRGPLARARVVAVLVAASLLHTAPWIALNASEARGLARFETLPLDGGRRENTIAFWHAERGDLTRARQWLDRALALNPGNVRALDLYGRIALDTRDARLAVRAYLIAVAYRPDKDDYRRQLAYAVGAAGGPRVGLALLDTLMAGHEENGMLWLERAMLLRASGRREEAAAAKTRALALVPALAAFADTLPLAAPAEASAPRP